MTCPRQDDTAALVYSRQLAKLEMSRWMPSARWRGYRMPWTVRPSLRCTVPRYRPGGSPASTRRSTSSGTRYSSPSTETPPSDTSNMPGCTSPIEYSRYRGAVRHASRNSAPARLACRASPRMSVPLTNRSTVTEGPASRRRGLSTTDTRTERQSRALVSAQRASSEQLPLGGFEFAVSQMAALVQANQPLQLLQQICAGSRPRDGLGCRPCVGGFGLVHGGQPAAFTGQQ